MGIHLCESRICAARSRGVTKHEFEKSNNDIISDRAFWLGVGLYAFVLVAAVSALGDNVPQRQTDFAGRPYSNGNSFSWFTEQSQMGVFGAADYFVRPVSPAPALAGSFTVAATGASITVTQGVPGLGNLSHCALLALGTNGIQMSGSAAVAGDVEVAGGGVDSLSGYARIDGDFIRRSNSTLVMWSTTAVTGEYYYNRSTELDNSRSKALGVSARAFALKPTRAYSNIGLGQSQSTKLSGAPGETVVLKLGNFTLGGNATLTLQGTATTTFVINVTKQFSLSGTSKIVLSGGLTWDHVLFNVTGTGPDVTVSGSAVLQGILMANSRTVKLSGQSKTIGAVIANRIVMIDASRVLQPPIQSP